MAALNDGKDFLVAHYAIAVTPGLTLTDPEPADRANASKSSPPAYPKRAGYPALPGVPGELAKISSLYSGASLQDEKFIMSNVKQEFGKESFNIVHIASHGQFKGDAKETFLLTYDGTLTLDDLESLIQPSQFRGEPVDLITLSACQTAAGDDSAVRAGPGRRGHQSRRHSALATLWFVNDQASSDLVEDFYQELKNDPSLTKAKALQRAQLKLLADPGKRYIHPSYWAPYLLIGNWL